jgi:hypothetical protein
MKRLRRFRVFISHSSSDKSFVLRLASALKKKSLMPWIDKEQILVGDDVLETLGEGLQKMDFLVLIVSSKALRSRWVERELKFAARREIEEKQILILPFIIDRTRSEQLPWYLQHLRCERVSPNDLGIAAMVDFITERASRRLVGRRRKSVRRRSFKRDPAVDKIVRGVGLGEWEKATTAALEILKQTDPAGRNELFESLLGYQNLPEDDKLLWSALHTIEMCVDLAPNLLSRLELSRLAVHPNFSVRSSAASICLNWAHFAPDRVPVDLLLKLSVYDEDWYVQAPANAALKTLVRAIPGVLQIFYSRLRSPSREERAHAATCIFDIAKTEPNLIDRDDLKRRTIELRKIHDHEALSYIQRIVARLRGKKRVSVYRYGL